MESLYHYVLCRADAGRPGVSGQDQAPSVSEGHLLKSLLAYGAGSFLPRIYAFLAIFLFSRILSVHDFGLFVFAIAVGEFCDFTTSAWFRVGFLRFYHAGTISSDEQRLNLTSVYLVTLRCIGVAVLLCWASAVLLVRDQWLTFGIATSLYVIANNTVQTSLNTLRGEGKSATYVSIEALRPLSNLLLGFAAIKLIEPTFFLAALGVFGGNALIGIVALTTIWLRRVELRGNDRINEIVGYAWPLVLSSFLTATMNAADRYQLQFWLGPSAVALYAAAYAIGRQPIDILFNALNLGSFTELMKSYDMAGPEAASRLLGRQIALMLALALPGVVGLSLLAPDILHALFDRRYWVGTAHLIPIIAVMALFAGLKSFGFDQGFHMMRKTRLQVYSMLPSVILGVGLSAILVNVYGLAGAAYGGCVGFGASLALSGFLVRRHMPGRLPYLQIAKIVVAAVTMAVFVELSRLYGHGGKFALVRTILIGVATYGAALWVLNVLGLRDRLRADVQKLLA